MLCGVLTSWIECEQQNLRRVQNALNIFEAPERYRTNSANIWDGGRSSVGITGAPDLTAASSAVKEQLGWLARQFAVAGDKLRFCGA